MYLNYWSYNEVDAITNFIQIECSNGKMVNEINELLSSELDTSAVFRLICY